MDVQICVGSSCHLKGSNEIVALFRQAIEELELDDRINLSGSFCLGKCNRQGVSVCVDGVIHTGITPESFPEFFREQILSILERM